MGIVIGNRRDVHIDHIMDFKEDLSTLLVSLLFVVLAARLHWPLPDGMLLGGALVFLAAQFVVRPVSAWLATLGSTLNWRQRALIAWVAPRGIVAAAVSALFALRLEELNVPGADALVPLVFSLIIGTVVVQSATARLSRAGWGWPNRSPMACWCSAPIRWRAPWPRPWTPPRCACWSSTTTGTASAPRACRAWTRSSAVRPRSTPTTTWT